MKRVAILQSNYIPWRGYFDIIGMVDEFIFHDDLQYTKQDWRNRNKIKTKNGLVWLTIPCGSNEKRLINEVTLMDTSWQKKHWDIIKANYMKAEFFNQYKEFFEDIYLSKVWYNLSDLNQYLIKKISIDILRLKPIFTNSTDYNPEGKKQFRVLDLCKKSETDVYISGPAAKNYIDTALFIKNDISIEWMDYGNYQEYKQLFPPFNGNVSIIDLLFNVGDDAISYLNCNGYEIS